MSNQSHSKVPRVRDLGASPGVLPTGTANALTDVPGVSVGHETIYEGDSESPPCKRTGVTAIRPADRSLYDDPVTGATHVINGYGKAVGLPQVNELGAIETPICLTNTLDTWRVAETLADHVAADNPDARSINPLVGECNDGRLNDIRGHHVTPEHVEAALNGTRSHNVAEGCVGAGTGMVGFGWKGGIGTASRVVDVGDSGHTIGALTLTNTGHPADLRVDGVRVGSHLRPSDADDDKTTDVAGDGTADVAGDEGNDERRDDQSPESDDGSILIVLGTDAPVSGRQLGRVARRGALGLGRTGATASHGSGDFVVAFANSGRSGESDVADADLSPLFRAAAEAVEEAIANSLVRATSSTGVGGTTYHALPTDELARLFE